MGVAWYHGEGRVAIVAEEEGPCRKNFKNTTSALLSPSERPRRRLSRNSFAGRERNTAFGTGMSGGPSGWQPSTDCTTRSADGCAKTPRRGCSTSCRIKSPETEPILGTYDAPALQILLGPAEVHVEPVGREVPFLAIRGASGTRTEFAGRIDISDGLREYNLYRERLQDGDRWQMPDKLNRFTYLDRQVFERILEELLS